MAEAVAEMPMDPHSSASSTVSFRRRLMPWSACRVPKAFLKDPSCQHETWIELANFLVDELSLLRDKDPDLAFQRLMVVEQAVGDAFNPVWNSGRVPEGSPLPSAVPAFLRAVAADGPGNVVERLLTALTNRSLDISLVSKDVFDDLSHADRVALVHRLAAFDPDSAEGRWVGPVLSHALLSEPNVGQLIAMTQTPWLWDRVDAARMLGRLIAGRRYVSHFPFLVIRAMQEAREQDRAALLSRALAFCQVRGKGEVAQQIRLRLFKETFGVAFAREWLRHVPAHRDVKAEEGHLLTRVCTDPRRGQALLFLLEWPSLTDAINLARTCHDEMDDIKAWQLRQASEQLEDVAPDAALKLYRKSDNIRDAYGNLPFRDVPSRDPPWHAAWSSS